MRTLSLRQPWAWAILHAGKRIENRTRCLSRTLGPFLLHASSGCTRDDYGSAVASMLMSEVIPGVAQAQDVPRRADLPLGGIVGRATIRGVIRPGAHGIAEAWVKAIPGLDLRWWDPEQFGFVLSDVEQLPFTPLKGARGFFNVDESTLRAA